MQAMLLAAGLGTRLGPYSNIRPKPLFPVLNVPLLHILLDMLTRAGCEHIVVNCHHLAGHIKAAVADRPGVVLQHEPEILGTGGGLRRALPFFEDGPVLVMNGDIFHDLDIRAFMTRHSALGLPVSMALHDYERFNSVIVRENKVRGFFSGTKSPRNELLAFTGIHVLHTDVIREIPENQFFHSIDLYERLAAQGLVAALRVDGCFWRDIGTPGDYLELHRELLCDRTHEKMDSDCNADTHSWCISRQAKIAESAVFRDWGVVGPGAVIGDNVELSRCIVWDGVTLASKQRLTDRIICLDEPGER